MLVDYQRLTAVKATTMFLIVWNNVLFITRILITGH